MRGKLGAAIDRRLAELIEARLRRSWPLLRLVPASWIRPIVAPIARRVRRSVYTGVASAALPLGSLVVLVALITSL